MDTPLISVIMPVYNVEPYVAASIESVLAQSFSDFELIIVDDEGTDGSMAVCHAFKDPRIRIIKQHNRGLAGARNTGIRHARGKYLAFLDSDDLWRADKLAKHAAHLDASPRVGVSYSASAFIDEHGRPLGISMRPKLHDVSAADVLCRNPVGNGSAPVIRRETLDAVAFQQNLHGQTETAYFDETFRQSEDIECWTRIAALTPWRFEGLGEALTLYRVNAGGLSANLDKQYEAWERMIAKARDYAPDLIKAWGARARAYQLRYLARRAVRMRDPRGALSLLRRALASDWRIAVEEPARTGVTLGSALLLAVLPEKWYLTLENAALRIAAARKRP